MQLTDIDTAVEVLVEAIRTDYRGYMDTYAGGWSGKGEMTEVQKNMVTEFDNSLTVKRGSKYTKIIQGGSVWGFVVNADDDKFKRGDILKAASYNAPARNAPRGNVFDGYQIQWTGPLYLK